MRDFFWLHIHGTQEAFSWHIGYSIHYVMHGYTVYTPTSQRGPSQAVSPKLHVLVSYSAGSLGMRLRRVIAGAQTEVAGARAPVCPSLATPLQWKSEHFIIKLFSLGTLMYIYLCITNMYM